MELVTIVTMMTFLVPRPGPRRASRLSPLASCVRFISDSAVLPAVSFATNTIKLPTKGLPTPSDTEAKETASLLPAQSPSKRRRRHQ